MPPPPKEMRSGAWLKMTLIDVETGRRHPRFGRRRCRWCTGAPSWSDREPGGERVTPEHLHGLERVLLEVLAE